jgi:RNA polymerase sigma factor (sigma-70 family)
MKINHSLSDLELMKTYCEGNNDALGMLFQRYSKKMLLRGYYLCESEDIADESVSAVFEQLLRLPTNKRQEIFAPDQLLDVRAMFLKMLHNKITDLLRAKVVRQRFVMKLQNILKPFRPATYIDTTQDDFERLKKLLSLREQEAMTLYQDGYEYKQIAEQMEVSVNTVKTLINRSKNKLKPFE